MAFLVALALALAPDPTWTQSGMRHVDPVDRTCGGRAPCYTTIQAAVSAALPGETVVLHAGTYREQVTVSGKNARPAASDADRIAIEADPAAPLGSVIVAAPAAACSSGHAFRFVSSRFVTLRGLTITGARGHGVWLAGGSGQNQGIRLERLRVFANGAGECGGGIAVGDANRGTLIANSLVHGNARNGIAFEGGDGGPHLVIGNTVHGNQWNGLAVSGAQQIFAVNNAITGNGVARGSAGGRHGVLRESAPPRPLAIHLWNNLVCGNRLGEFSGPALDPTDTGNLTPTGSEGRGVARAPGCGQPAALYRDADGADGVAGTSDDDFYPAAGSPAIDRGLDPDLLGLPPAFAAILEADYSGPATRPRDGDRLGLARFDIGALELQPVNRPPVADAGRDRSVTSDTLTNLDGSGSFDPDGDSLSYFWSQTGGPAVALTGSTSPTPGFASPGVTSPTALVFSLRVSDGVLSSTASVTIVVTPRPNRPPVIEPIPDQRVDVGDRLMFTVVASDPDGDRVTLSAAVPANAAFDTATGTFTFTPVQSQVGSHLATFSATDGRETVSRTASVTVTSALVVAITSPSAGASLSAGLVIVRGTVHAGGEAGVAVNGVPAAVQGTDFAAAVPVDATTATLTAVAATATGTTATHTIPVAVTSRATGARLITSPPGGAAPLVVTFSLLGGPAAASVSLDLVGDGVADFTGPALDGERFVYSAPGLYFPTATVTDQSGATSVVSAVVQVLDLAGLDALLQAKWTGMKDALRRGDIPAALTFIVEGARASYEEALRAITPHLGAIDTILTDIAGLTAQNGIAVYHAERTDDALPMLFEVRFAIDADGIWRIQSF